MCQSLQDYSNSWEIRSSETEFRLYIHGDSTGLTQGSPKQKWLCSVLCYLYSSEER